MNKADSSLGFFRKIQSDKVCVFISHKKEDQDITIGAADKILDHMVILRINSVSVFL